MSRLKKIEEALNNTRRRLESGKRYYAAPSYQQLKTGERWTDERCRIVEADLTVEEKMNLQILKKRLLTEEAVLRTELTSEGQ